MATQILRTAYKISFRRVRGTLGSGGSGDERARERGGAPWCTCGDETHDCAVTKTPALAIAPPAHTHKCVSELEICGCKYYVNNRIGNKYIQK